MTSTAVGASRRPSPGGPDETVGALGRRTRRLSWLLVAAALVAALPTLLVDGVLNGPAVMNGSARGTALVVLALAVPVLIGSLARPVPSPRNHACALGALGYLAYNAGLFVYATPFNELFLAYVAMLGLAVWAMVSALVDLPTPGPVPEGLPARAIAGFLVGIATLNGLGWLGFIVPDLGNADDPAFLHGTGLTTNPIYVQDLALAIPAVVTIAVLLWQRRPWGGLLGGAALVFWVVESVGVAVDQVFGHRADPSSDVATYGGAVMFVVLGVLSTAALVVWLHHHAPER